MCGIAGIISWSGQHRVTRDALATMSAAIAHRGPDGEGIHLSHEGEPSHERPQVGLVHRRLAILDPDPRSDQPFTDGRGRWIVFNGEIYNYRELRKELESLHPSYPWRTSGDTEVLLAAYAEWGEKCVDHLNGMFAFAIWDEGLNARDYGTLFLARDRMGQKPMYVAYARPSCDDWPDGMADHMPDSLDAIAFASELSALKQISWADHSLDARSLEAYLRWGYIPARQTIFTGVTELAPGSTATVIRGDHTLKFYYSANRPVHPVPPPVDDAAAVRGTRDAVTLAVNRQLVSDVPIGCFLSGGIDSSVVALAMTKATARPASVRTFSIGFDDPRYDESSYAAEVARHLGTTHETIVVKPRLDESLQELARAFGQPFGDSSALPTYWLSKATRAHVKVALSGDGGDELFGGYDRYRAIRLVERARSLFGSAAGGLASLVAQRLASGHPKSRRVRLARLAEALQLPTHRAYGQMMRLMSDEQIRELQHGASPAGRGSSEPLGMATSRHAGDHAAVPDDRVADQLKLNRSALDVVRSAMAVDRSQYLPGDLLTKVDRASMLHNLEVRSPFMDHELVQFAFGLTTDQLLRGGPKRMLREAFASELPPSVFARKKMGFAVPIGDWFRGELRPMLHDQLFATNSFVRAHFNLPAVQRMVDEHEQSRVDHSQRLYALLMLELWWRMNQG